jgi:hypothetical protein
MVALAASRWPVHDQIDDLKRIHRRVEKEADSKKRDP